MAEWQLYIRGYIFHCIPERVPNFTTAESVDCKESCTGTPAWELILILTTTVKKVNTVT